MHLLKVSGNICGNLTHAATWDVKALDMCSRLHVYPGPGLLTRVGHVCVLIVLSVVFILAEHQSVLEAARPIIETLLTHDAQTLPVNYFTDLIIYEN